MKPKTCPECGKTTGHLPVTFAAQTTDSYGRLKVVARGLCGDQCCSEAMRKWRAANVPPPVKTAPFVTTRDLQHGGKLMKLGDR
jgi:hypothetical protein